MKVKARKAGERPSRITKFQATVIAHDAERMYEVLEGFNWTYEKGDAHHWIPLFNHFDAYLAKTLGARWDLTLQAIEKLDTVQPLPVRNILGILRCTGIILRHTSHKQIYSSLEHICSLLACREPEITVACLDVLLEYAKRTWGGNLRWTAPAELSARLEVLAVTSSARQQAVTLKDYVQPGRPWPPEDSGGWLFECGPTVGRGEPADGSGAQPSKTIDLSGVVGSSTCEWQTLKQLCQQHGVPPASRFALLMRIRDARFCGELAWRQHVTELRMKAMWMLTMRENSKAKLLDRLSEREPDLVNEVQELLKAEDAVPVAVRTATLFGLAALCIMHRQRRSPSVDALLSGGPGCFFATMLAKVVAWMHSPEGQTAVEGAPAASSALYDLQYLEGFMTVLHMLITLIIAPMRGPGTSAEVWILPKMLAILDSRAPQHQRIQVVTLRLLEMYLECAPSVGALFLQLDGTAKILSCMSDLLDQEIRALPPSDPTAPPPFPPVDRLTVPYLARHVLQALMHTYALARYHQPPPTDRAPIAGEFRQLAALCTRILRHSHDFGGMIFYLCESTVTDMLHYDPTQYETLAAEGLPEAFMGALRAGVLPHVDAVTALPATIEALSLTERGRELVKKYQPLRCVVPVLTHKAYAGVIVQGEFGQRVEELIRHLHSDLRPYCLDVMLAVLRMLCAVGGDSAALAWAPGDVAAAAAAPDPTVAEMPMDGEPAEAAATPSRGAGAVVAPGATLPATGSPAGDGGGAGPTRSEERSEEADEVESAVSYSSTLQDGCLPGLGPGGVVLEWSHVQADPEQLEVMMNTASVLMDYVVQAESQSSDALVDKGGLDLLFRLYSAPHFPIKLLQSRQLKASLLPPQALRSQQHRIAGALITRSAEALDPALNDALAIMTRHASRPTLLDLPPEELQALMQAMAKVAGLLAVAADLVRPLVPMLKELSAGRDGPSMLAKVGDLERLAEVAMLRNAYWLDSGNLKRLREAQALRLEARKAARAAARREGTADDDLEAMEEALDASKKSPSKASKQQLVEEQASELLCVLCGHIRALYVAVCKCVHNPVRRTVPAAADPATRCILTVPARYCITYVAMAKRASIAALDAPELAAELAAMLPPSGCKQALVLLQKLADDVRCLLFEARRKEYHALLLAFMLASGAIRGVARRFAQALDVCKRVLVAAAEERAAVAAAAPPAAAPATATAAGAATDVDAAVDMDVDDDANLDRAVSMDASASQHSAAGRDTGGHLAWKSTEAVAAATLASYLNVASLLLARTYIAAQPSSALLTEAGPSEVKWLAPPSATVDEALDALQSQALSAVLLLWGAVVRNEVPLPKPLLQHLIKVLRLAYSAANAKPAADVAVAAAAAAPARAAPSAFAPDPSVVQRLCSMGFPENQVDFVMGHLRSNELGQVCTWFCDHDVQAEMDRAAAAKKPDVSEDEALARAMASSMSVDTASSPPPLADVADAALPTVAALADDVLAVCRRDPLAVFSLAPLLAVASATDDSDALVVWLVAKLRGFGLHGPLEDGAGASTSAAVAADVSAAAADDDAAHVLLHLFVLLAAAYPAVVQKAHLRGVVPLLLAALRRAVAGAAAAAPVRCLPAWTVSALSLLEFVASVQPVLVDAQLPDPEPQAPGEQAPGARDSEGGAAAAAPAAAVDPASLSALLKTVPQFWAPCGLLSEGEQTEAMELCGAIVDLLHAHADDMPRLPVAQLTETTFFTVPHPRAVFLAVLQVYTRLAGKQHAHALTVLKSGVAAKLLTMPPAALSLQVSSHYTSLFASILEDAATLQSTMETRIRSIISGQPSYLNGMPVHAFFKAAEGIALRDPVVFATAVTNLCELYKPPAGRVPPSTPTLVLKAKKSTFGGENAASNVLPAKRTASGEQRSSPTVSAAAGDAPAPAPTSGQPTPSADDAAPGAATAAQERSSAPPQGPPGAAPPLDAQSKLKRALQRAAVSRQLAPSFIETIRLLVSHLMAAYRDCQATKLADRPPAKSPDEIDSDVRKKRPPETTAAGGGAAMDVDGAAGGSLDAEAGGKVEKRAAKAAVDAARDVSNMWEVSKADAPTLRVGLLLNMLTEYTLRYNYAAHLILREGLRVTEPSKAAGVPAPPTKPLADPSQSPLLRLVLLDLMSDSRAVTGSDSNVDRLCTAAMFFALAVCIRSFDGRARVIQLVFSQLRQYRAALLAAPGPLRAAGSCPLLHVPGSPATPEQVGVYVNFVVHLAYGSSRTRASTPASFTSELVRSLREADAVKELSLVLEAVDMGHPAASDMVTSILQVLGVLTKQPPSYASRRLGAAAAAGVGARDYGGSSNLYRREGDPPGRFRVDVQYGYDGAPGRRGGLGGGGGAQGQHPFARDRSGTLGAGFGGSYGIGADPHPVPRPAVFALPENFSSMREAAIPAPAEGQERPADGPAGASDPSAPQNADQAGPEPAGAPLAPIRASPGPNATAAAASSNAADEPVTPSGVLAEQHPSQEVEAGYDASYVAMEMVANAQSTPPRRSRAGVEDDDAAMDASFNDTRLMMDAMFNDEDDGSEGGDLAAAGDDGPAPMHQGSLDGGSEDMDGRGHGNDDEDDEEDDDEDEEVEDDDDDDEGAGMGDMLHPPRFDNQAAPYGRMGGVRSGGGGMLAVRSGGARQALDGEESGEEDEGDDDGAGEDGGAAMDAAEQLLEDAVARAHEGGRNEGEQLHFHNEGFHAEGDQIADGFAAAAAEAAHLGLSAPSPTYAPAWHTAAEPARADAGMDAVLADGWADGPDGEGALEISLDAGGGGAVTDADFANMLDAGMGGAPPPDALLPAAFRGAGVGARMVLTDPLGPQEAVVYMAPSRLDDDGAERGAEQILQMVNGLGGARPRVMSVMDLQLDQDGVLSWPGGISGDGGLSGAAHRRVSSGAFRQMLRSLTQGGSTRPDARQVLAVIRRVLAQDRAPPSRLAQPLSALMPANWDPVAVMNGASRSTALAMGLAGAPAAPGIAPGVQELLVQQPLAPSSNPLLVEPPSALGPPMPPQASRRAVASYAERYGLIANIAGPPVTGPPPPSDHLTSHLLQSTLATQAAPGPPASRARQLQDLMADFAQLTGLDPRGAPPAAARPTPAVSAAARETSVRLAVLESALVSMLGGDVPPPAEVRRPFRSGFTDAPAAARAAAAAAADAGATQAAAEPAAAPAEAVPVASALGQDTPMDEAPAEQAQPPTVDAPPTADPPPTQPEAVANDAAAPSAPQPEAPPAAPEPVDTEMSAPVDTEAPTETEAAAAPAAEGAEAMEVDPVAPAAASEEAGQEQVDGAPQPAATEGAAERPEASASAAAAADPAAEVLDERTRALALAAGLDLEVLQSLPPELIADVLAQAGIPPPAPAAAAAAAPPRPSSGGEIDRMLLAMLPPEMRDEALRAERQRQDRVRQEAVAQLAQAVQGAVAGAGPAAGGSEEGVDYQFASELQSWPREAREDALLAGDDAMLARLPQALRDEAQALRRRRGIPAGARLHPAAAAAAGGSARGPIWGSGQRRGAAAARPSRPARSPAAETVLDFTAGAERWAQGRMRPGNSLLHPPKHDHPSTRPALDDASLEVLLKLVCLFPAETHRFYVTKVLSNASTHAAVEHALAVKSLRLIADVLEVPRAGPGGAPPPAVPERPGILGASLTRASLCARPKCTPAAVLHHLVELLKLLVISSPLLTELLVTHRVDAEMDPRGKGLATSAPSQTPGVQLLLHALAHPLVLASPQLQDSLVSLLHTLVCTVATQQALALSNAFREQLRAANALPAPKSAARPASEYTDMAAYFRSAHGQGPPDHTMLAEGLAPPAQVPPPPSSGAEAMDTDAGPAQAQPDEAGPSAPAEGASGRPAADEAGPSTSTGPSTSAVGSSSLALQPVPPLDAVKTLRSLDMAAVQGLPGLFSAPTLSEDNLSHVARCLVLLVQLSPRLLPPMLHELRAPLAGTRRQLLAALEPAAQWEVPAATTIADCSARLLQMITVVKRLVVVASNFLGHHEELVRARPTVALRPSEFETPTQPLANSTWVESRVAADDLVKGNVSRLFGEAAQQLREIARAEADERAAADAAAPPPDVAGPSGRPPVGGAADDGGGGEQQERAPAAADKLLLLPSVAEEAGVGVDVVVRLKDMREALRQLVGELTPLWQQLSLCMDCVEAALPKSDPVVPGAAQPKRALSPGAWQLKPLIEGFLLLCAACGLVPSRVDGDSLPVPINRLSLSSSGSIHRASSLDHSLDAPRAEDPFAASLMPGSFMEKHRRLLNAYLHAEPELLETTFAALLHIPRLIDFGNKASFFQHRLRQRASQSRPYGSIKLNVHRHAVFQDSFWQIIQKSAEEMTGDLSVKFVGEEGVDAGGLTREWYQVMAREIFNPDLALFVSVPEGASTYQPNPLAVIQSERLVDFKDYFRFVGRIVGKALLDGQLLNAYFTRSFYKHMLDVPLNLDDLEAMDPDYFKSLKWMLEHDITDVVDATFSAEADFFGRKDTVELKPGGAHVAVTNENKAEYVTLMARHRMTTAIAPSIQAFQAGLWEIVPLELLRIFNNIELELMISGLPDIDVADLRANTTYTGLAPGCQVVQWFWQVVEEMDKQDLASLVQFVTGTSKVPLGGFGNLQGISGAQKFSIHRAYGDVSRLPSAHTCFNQLDLVEYESKEQLRERLLLAIHEGATGFGFA